jgi:hypothetical protein
MLPTVKKIASLPRGSRLGRLVRASVALCALSLTSLITLGGCGASIGELCDLAAQCEGGNDFDYDACEIRFNELADQASVRNCNDEYDAWLECYEQEARCNDDRYRVQDDECEREEEQLEDCAEVKL